MPSFTIFSLGFLFASKTATNIEIRIMTGKNQSGTICLFVSGSVGNAKVANISIKMNEQRKTPIPFITLINCNKIFFIY